MLLFLIMTNNASPLDSTIKSINHELLGFHYTKQLLIFKASIIFLYLPKDMDKLTIS